jgi:hypothetical protein
LSAGRSAFLNVASACLSRGGNTSTNGILITSFVCRSSRQFYVKLTGRSLVKSDEWKTRALPFAARPGVTGYQLICELPNNTAAAAAAATAAAAGGGAVRITRRGHTNHTDTHLGIAPTRRLREFGRPFTPLPHARWWSYAMNERIRRVRPRSLTSPCVAGGAAGTRLRTVQGCRRTDYNDGNGAAKRLPTENRRP